jgi:hypothetical protein
MPQWLCATLAISAFGVAAGSQAAEPMTAGPADGDLEWIYSCPSSKGCAFSCPTGAGGATAATGEATTVVGRAMAATGGTMAATHVTKLTIHLRWLEIGNRNAQAIFNYGSPFGQWLLDKHWTRYVIMPSQRHDVRLLRPYKISRSQTVIASMSAIRSPSGQSCPRLGDLLYSRSAGVQCTDMHSRERTLSYQRYQWIT